MAELILTDEEKTAALWTDLSDEAVGKLVKARMAAIADAAKQSERMTTYAAALLLACSAAEVNAGKLTWNLDGVTQSGRDFGDWVVRVERLNVDQSEAARARAVGL